MASLRHLACGMNNPMFLLAQTAITVDSVTRLRLFEDGGAECTLLALHPPDDPTQGSGADRATSAGPAGLTRCASWFSFGGVPAREVVARGRRVANLSQIQKRVVIGKCPPAAAP